MKKNILIGLIVGIVIIIAGLYLLYPNSENQNYQNNGETTLPETTNSYTDLSAQEAKDLIESTPDLTIIDVSPYYEEGHLPGAVSYYPLSKLQEATNSLDKNATYLVYCHADGPSRAGAQTLIEAGFTNVYRLESHYGGWVEAGFETEK